MDQAFNTIIQLDKETKCSHAADNTVELFADKLCHVLDLLHVGRLTLSLNCHTLTLGCMICNFRQDQMKLRLTLRRNRAGRKCFPQ